ncbi:tape measure protein [Dysgonomonas massiliensis]|uniref:tape measure protein n=1 Tax=Dysgonomonas massiliensis TaxID=2040292 RepID=UPI000C759DA0|nr:tape measure protein [Dysgonomonas massiliensis]
MAGLSFEMSADDKKLRDGIANVEKSLLGLEQSAMKAGKALDESFRIRQETQSNIQQQLNKVVDSLTSIDGKVGQTKAEVKDLDKVSKDASTSIGTSFKSIAAVAGGAFGVHSILRFKDAIIQARKETQMLETSFEVLLGSREKADMLLSKMRELALKSPLSVTDVSKGAQMLLSFNVEASKTIPILNQIGDISMGDSQKFQSLTLAFSQMSSAGRLMGQDLLQMINAGFNPLQEISAKTGKSIADLKKEMEGGAITVQMVEDAFRSATSEGGRFYGMMDKQSSGIAGKQAQLEDAILNMHNELGQSMEGLISGSYDVMTAFVKNYEKIGEILIGLIATYGAYKTAVLALSVVEKIRYQATLAQMAGMTKMQAVMDILRFKTAALNKTMLANPYVAVTAAVVALGYATYKLVTYQTDLDKSQKRLKDTSKEYERTIVSEQTQLDILFGRLKAAKEGTDEYQQAKENILKKYGSYLSGLSEEIRTLKDVEGAYKAISRAAIQAAKDRAIERGTQEASDAYTEEYQKNILKVRNAFFKKFGEAEGTLLLDSFKKSFNEGSEFTKEVKKAISSFDEVIYSANGAAGSVSSYSNNAVQNAIVNMKRSKEILDSEVKMIEDIYGTLSNTEGINEETVKFKTYSEQVSEAREQVKKLINERNKLLNGELPNELAEGTQFDFAKGIEDKTKQLKEAQEKLNILLNGSSASEASNTNKYLEKAKEEARKKADELEKLNREARQAEINQMQDGLEKEIAQIEHNYAAKIAELRKQEKKWRDAQKGELTKDQETTIETAYQNADKEALKAIDKASKASKEAEKKKYDEMLNEFQSYQDKYAAAQKTFNDKKAALEKARTPENSDQIDRSIQELEYKRDETLNSINEEFASREETYQVWVNELASWSLDQLKSLLAEAKRNLEQLKQDGVSDTDLAIASAKVKKLEKEISDVNKKLTPKQRTIKEWSELHNVLSDVTKSFEDIGNEVGGTAGEILKTAGQISSSTLSMIDSIVMLSKESTTTIQGLSQAANRAIQAVEKASVILAVITSAIQILQKLNSITKDSHDKYLDYDAKIERINDLKDAVNDYELAVLRATQAEKAWFGEDGLRNLKDYKEQQEKIYQMHEDKLNEMQAKYQNKKGGGWLTGILDYGLLGGIDWALGTNILGNKYDERLAKAVDNLRIETRKRKKGIFGSGIGSKSQKTEDLRTWVKRELGFDLFDADGWINQEAYEVIMEKYSNKLVGQTKETLEELSSLKEQYDEYLKQLREYVSSLYEPLVDNMVNSLWDWLDGGKDALDSFKNYASDTFRDIVTDMMRTIVLEKVVGSFQDDIADIYEKYSSGKLTEKQLANLVADRTEQLTSDYEKNIPALQTTLAEINKIFENIGLSLENAESVQQSGSSGYEITASQESVNALNARMGGLLSGVISIDSSVKNLEQWSLLNSANIGNITNNVQILVNTQLQSMYYLSDIANYTKPIANMANDIADIKRNTEGV